MGKKHGEFRTAFDAAGIRTSTAHLGEVADWSEHPHYTETKYLFLLARLGAMKPADILVTSKRGLPDFAAGTACGHSSTGISPGPRPRPAGVLSA